MVIRLLAAGLVSLAASSCSSQPEQPTFIGRWDVPGNDSAYIEFNTDGTWSASDGCNTMGGHFEADGQEFSSPDAPSHTQVFCSPVTEFDKLIPRTDKIEVSGKSATLISGGHDLLQLEQDPS